MVNYFWKSGFSQIERDEEQLLELEIVNTNFENYIIINQELRTFGALSGRKISDLQT